jgi:hypothetical protein
LGLSRLSRVSLLFCWLWKRYYEMRGYPLARRDGSLATAA